jgi:hypothetical protein
MAVFKLALLGLVVSLIMGSFMPSPALLDSGNDNNPISNTRIGNTGPVDEKFEGGVKVHDRRDHEIDDMSPYGPGGN